MNILHFAIIQKVGAKAATKVSVLLSIKNITICCILMEAAVIINVIIELLFPVQKNI